MTKDPDAPKTVLVADDDPDVRLVLAVILERAGYSVTEASNGAEVLEIVEKDPPDLILLDFAMPKLDGRRTLQLLKSNPKTSHVPVVIVSATRDDTLAQELSSLGASIYLVKPWGEGQIERVVAAALGNNK
ncbi:MAG: response regulator [Chloroflexi bacterium]|nr:response regulator [Chloroflexota bacterium]